MSSSNSNNFLAGKLYFMYVLHKQVRYIYFSIYLVADQRYSDFVFTELPNIDKMNFINKVLEFGLSHTCIYVHIYMVYNTKY